MQMFYFNNRSMCQPDKRYMRLSRLVKPVYKTNCPRPMSWKNGATEETKGHKSLENLFLRCPKAILDWRCGRQAFKYVPRIYSGNKQTTMISLGCSTTQCCWVSLFCTYIVFSWNMNKSLRNLLTEWNHAPLTTEECSEASPTLVINSQLFHRL